MTGQVEAQEELRVIVHPSKWNQWEDICKSVLEEYAQRFWTRFELWVPKKNVRRPPKNPRKDTVYIFVGCTPVRSESARIKSAFGHDLWVSAMGINGFLPSEEGIVISDDNCQELAEVVGRSIYILFWPTVREGYMEPVFRAILDRALFWIFEASDEDRRAYEENRSRGEKDRFAGLFGDWAGAIKATESQLKKNKKIAEELQQSLAKAIESLSVWEEYASMLKARGARDMQTVRDEYDRIMAMSKVKRLKVYSDRLVVFTEMITVCYKNLIFEIGEFRIEIDLSGKGLRMYNLTHPKPDKECNMQHPHVGPDGIPCLGNIKEAIPQFIAQREMGVVVTLSLQYLETLNLDDWRAQRNFFYWPLQGENEEDREKRVRAFEEELKKRRDPKLEENPVPLIDEMYCSQRQEVESVV
ncbi:MAG: hypothetical protein A2667_02790 [Candidatus Wildermuthbacteria bacterium RIFCSPHIGHO2_01_FULL_47_27]|uniref:Uncharacterized protein n=2 Tax=Candidatus Wildermuthiibacteriota TaxID=1817923 RepID=A0A1G2RRF5_9BACT|nr:MAG: hypothetical protein UY15_C0014G0013 [Parcubacteria group bacterium GW2011_GWA2_47_9]OHA65048.1 MAG: hypothetical protein A2667_02790 [Candidatus Wildermuthbacteria bacterium RIFCSPHIGHO2_01_FULL_47_27]OHA66988.1 MAG: hypothetical protein A3D59_01515 [Candidatus Wildermuthbacteria bacterium RIFCSPHIGHO2_02_FULL_47_17]OHA75426.1 MAG: hypothetical protein A3A32_00085 [Candidatus Wildermuthbacteria bacterium RIFCSPLOWO2_01_FULL_48_35]